MRSKILERQNIVLAYKLNILKRLYLYISRHTKNVKKFNTRKTTPLSTQMLITSLQVRNDLFWPPEEKEEIIGPKILNLSAILDLTYLGNCTGFDISFTINPLVRFSLSPTQMHWNVIKHVFHYLQEITDLLWFYSKNSNGQIVGFAGEGYLLDQHNAQSQKAYEFTIGRTVIFCHSKW